MTGEERFQELVERARGDDHVLGLFLFGSRGRGIAVDERSDYDVAVVLRDEAALARFDAEYPYEHGSPVEVASSTLAGLRAHGAFGSESEWARYQYAHLRMLVDKTGGEIQRVVDDKAVVPDGVRPGRVREALDSFVNLSYRSARNRLVGLEAAARLDAVEAIPPFLTTIFMLEGRIRPFNKYVEWELSNYPLSEDAWAADRLLPMLMRILGFARPADQQALFRDVERVARAHGFGDVIDGWEPDVRWLRGEEGYRERP